MLVRAIVIISAFFAANVFAGNFSYIMQVDQNFYRKITRCLTDSLTGELKDCSYTGENISEPVEVILNSDSSIAYIPNRISNYNGLSEIYRCRVNQKTGMLENCATVVSEVSLYIPLNMRLNSNNSMAYVLNSNESNDSSSIVRCNVNASTGDLSHCRNSKARTLYPFEFNSDSSVVYGLNDDDAIVYCGVDPVTGDFSGCSDAVSSDQRSKLPDYSDNLTISRDDSFAFISGYDYGPDYPKKQAYGVVTSCRIDPETKTFKDCTKLVDDQLLKRPEDIASNRNQRGLQLFVTDANEKTNRVIRCDANSSTGELTNCGSASSENFLSPNYIKFSHIH